MPKETGFFALIGALQAKSSRDPERQDNDYKRFISQIEHVNGQYPRAMVAPLIAAGRQCQGLFHDGAGVMDAVIGISESMAEIPVCFGIGLGELSTPLSGNASHMDGKCFHRARDALQSTGQLSRWIQFKGLQPAGMDEVCSAMLNLYASVKSAWTAKQRQYFQAARHSRQNRVASRFGVSPSVISESLKSARSSEILEIERALYCYFREQGGSGNI